MNMAMMASMLSAMGGGGEGRPGGLSNPMLAAMMKNMPGMGGMPMMGGASSGSSPVDLMSSMMNMMGGGQQQAQAPSAPTTTTPAPPSNSFSSFGANQGGFQLPSHLQSLLPNGLSSGQGFKPQDLIAMRSSQGQGGSQGISSLLSSMNPLAMLGAGGLGGPMGGGPGRAPMDPELMAEQREERRNRKTEPMDPETKKEMAAEKRRRFFNSVMMRAMMANAMKSMMGGGQPQRGTNATNASPNNGMNMLTMMALQNGLGGGSGGGGGSALDSMLPFMMGGGMGGLLGGMGGGGGGAGLLSGLFGGM